MDSNLGSHISQGSGNVAHPWKVVEIPEKGMLGSFSGMGVGCLCVLCSSHISGVRGNVGHRSSAIGLHRFAYTTIPVFCSDK